MKALSCFVRPSKKGNPITIYFLSCLHIGARCHDRERTIDLLTKIKNEPDTYAVSLGDTCDIGTKNSPGGSVYEQELNARDQTIVAASLIQPIVDEGKILFAVESNHSARLYNETGFFSGEETLFKLYFGGGLSRKDKNLLEKYAAGSIQGKEKMRVRAYLEGIFEHLRPNQNPQVQWGGMQALVNLHVGQQTYRIHAVHGSGGGTSAGAVVNALWRQSHIAEADLYACGHFHAKAALDFCQAVWKDGKIEYRRKWLLATGSHLNYDSSYAELKVLPPKSLGMSNAVFESATWGITCQI